MQPSNPIVTIVVPSLLASFRYRPEIDGLRGAAVLAVVLFHAGLGVPGGGIGVDVFFVISGFLITSLILKDLEGGAFTIASFWERRARRILPALTVVVLATLVAGWFLLLPGDYESLGRAAFWQAAFGANVHYYLETSYFSGAAEEKPLLRTWSLAVEEQFYLALPLTLLVLLRLRACRARLFLPAVFAAGVVLSLAASIYGVANHRAAAFFLLPTRAWELLLGSFVAVTPNDWLPRSNAVREVISLAGLGGVIVPCLLYTKDTSFPGLAAVPPCVGAALVIWSLANDIGAGNYERLIVARLLTARSLVSFPIHSIFGIGLYSLSFLGATSKHHSGNIICAPTRTGCLPWTVSAFSSSSHVGGSCVWAMVSRGGWPIRRLSTLMRRTIKQEFTSLPRSMSLPVALSR